jgi:hypothetical protein
MSYIILRGRWSDITVLNVHAPTEDKSDVKTASMRNQNVYLIPQIPYEDVVRRFQCQRHFQTIGNGSLHEISNDNGARVVNFAKSKNHVMYISQWLKLGGISCSQIVE